MLRDANLGRKGNRFVQAERKERCLMNVNQIRPIAICVVRNGGHILVEHGFDPAKDQHFYRPPGGGIEFGERAVETIHREFREELDAELADPLLLGVVENLFHFEGRPHHEIVFVFEARFQDARLNEQREFIISEPSGQNRASWKSLGELSDGQHPLYPEGLLDLLRKQTG